MVRNTEQDDRAEIVAILTEATALRTSEADHVAGMIVAAGFSRPPRMSRPPYVVDPVSWEISEVTT